MAVQSEYGKLSIFEDFAGHLPTTTISDATALRFNNLVLIAVSGDVDVVTTVDESGGVISFTGAGGAADGIGITTGMVYQPSSNGPITCEYRFKGASASDLRVFAGWQETMLLTEPVNPFTLSGTTLTSNDGGNVVGFYTDTSATTDDFRFHASLDGTELTTAVVESSVDGSSTLGALGIRAQCTLTADSWYIARVTLYPDGSAEGWFGHTSMANNTGLTRIARLAAGTLDPAALYFPHLHLAAASIGDPLLEADYFAAKGNRDWAA